MVAYVRASTCFTQAQSAGRLSAEPVKSGSIAVFVLVLMVLSGALWVQPLLLLPHPLHCDCCGWCSRDWHRWRRWGVSENPSDAAARQWVRRWSGGIYCWGWPSGKSNPSLVPLMLLLGCWLSGRRSVADEKQTNVLSITLLCRDLFLWWSTAAIEGILA